MRRKFARQSSHLAQIAPQSATMSSAFSWKSISSISIVLLFTFQLKVEYLFCNSEIRTLFPVNFKNLATVSICARDILRTRVFQDRRDLLSTFLTNKQTSHIYHSPTTLHETSHTYNQINLVQYSCSGMYCAVHTALFIVYRLQ